MSEEFRAALASSDTVTVVGVGNVAMDCARILAKGEKRQLPCMRCKFCLGDIDRHIFAIDAQRSQACAYVEATERGRHNGRS